ncbi:hypothetical protein EMPS_01513 [Entomortierella parvispora]|uniref:Formin GTPase-binding domain-containing protein n=1 Tax=Entomortierella parvispora TaxID=205924 RepID=A0A9P3H3Q3_9FUNG|nr:hypothetical protein EMPS_01513 [Entomortierella parvispora]
MTDPELSSFLHQDNSNPRPFSPLSPTHHLSSTLPPPSPSSNKHYHRHPPPPPVKTRSHLSNLGDHIVKAARRLSTASTPKDPSSHPSSPTPLFSRLGATSPDIKKKRGSAIFLDDSTPTPGSGGGHSHSNSTISNSNSSGVNSTIMPPPPRHRNKASGGEPREKGKGKLLAKIDLFNMLSRNANHAPLSPTSFVGPTKLQQSEQQQQQPLGTDRSLPAPPTPSKETFWRGIMVRQNGVCTEEDYKVLHSPGQLPGMNPTARTTTIESSSRIEPTAMTTTTRDDPHMAPSGATRIDSKFGSDSFRPAAVGHTDMHDSVGVRNVDDRQNKSARSYKGDVKVVESKQTQGPGLSTQGAQDGQGGVAGIIVGVGKSAGKRGTDARADSVVAMLPPNPTSRHPKHQPPQQDHPQKQQQMTSSTMSQDLSHHSISSLQESDASLSDRSLQMEELFDFYEDSSSGPFPESAAQTLTAVTFADAVHPFGASAPSAPLSALEKIQRQQRRRSQEQERLANLILPVPIKNQTEGVNVLPVRDIPRELLPAHVHVAATSPLALGGPSVAANTVEESIRLDQILALASGPNRPRLPNPIEWQRGLEEMRQKRRDSATPLTSSVGRHSQESSMDGGKSRRHSMPDLPPGQSREDQERQRGDGFRNPMLLKQIHESLAFGSGGTDDEYVEVQDQQQQMRSTIAESQAMDATNVLYNTANAVVLSEPPKPMRKRAGNVTGVAVPAGRIVLHGRDAVDVAFEELLDTLALPPSARAELESMPKERKLVMLQSNDASQHLSQMTQTMPPHYFVDTLLEFAGKRERTSPNQRRLMNLQIGSQPSLVATGPGNTKIGGATKPLGLWKNLSTTNIGQIDSSVQHQQSQLLPTFQQHLASLINRNSNEAIELEKRSLDEREQVLKKLRVLIRNGSIRWTGEFIKAGGPMALIEYGHQIQKTRDSKQGQRERLLHQVIQCIKAVVPLEEGISSLVQERSFFPLMRTLAILESPVLVPTRSGESTQGRQARPSFIPGVATDYQQQPRFRSSSIPKPLSSPFQSSPALSLDQIPTFSNAQASVGILTAILAREPELRDRILRETVADEIIGGPHGVFSDEEDEHLWTYSQWIGYLDELLQMCGVNATKDTPVTTIAKEQPIGRTGPTHGMPSKGSSVAAGLSFLSTSPTGATSGLSLFSLDNIKRRRHTSAAATSTSSPTLKFEAGEDREVISFLTAHLELVSRLMFDMHISVPGLAFAKSIRNSHLQEAFERTLLSHIQNQDLCAQVEDLLIQISMVPKPYTNNHQYRTAIRSSGNQQHRVSYPQPQQKVRQEWLRPASASPQPSQQRQKQMQMPHYHQQQQHRGSALQGSRAMDHAQYIPARSSSLDMTSPTDSVNSSALGGQAVPLSRQPSAARRIAEGMVILGRDGSVTPTRARFSPSPTPSPSLQPPRRATIGDTGTNTNSTSNLPYLATNHHASRLPVLPPKSKNRLSMDQRSGLASPAQSPLPLHSHLPPPPSTADATPRSQYSQSHIPPTSLAAEVKLTVTSKPTSAQPRTGAHVPRQEKSTGLKAPVTVANTRADVNTQLPQAREQTSETLDRELASSPTLQLPRPKVLRNNSGSSINTFGNGGRRSSLGVADLPLIIDGNHPTLAMDDQNTATTSSNAKVAAAVNPSTVRGHHLRPPRAPPAALELSSSSSTSTSSIFTESSSSSTTVSPPSSQGRKQALQQTTQRSMTPTALTTTTTVMGSRLPVPAASPIALSPQGPPTSTTSSKPVVTTNTTSLALEEDKVVDFDLKIQEDVRKLASATSSSSLSAQRRQDASSVDAMRRREIQETANPLVLSAPIVVREDLFRLRDQNIREQFSAIVLPPLERS